MEMLEKGLHFLIPQNPLSIFVISIQIIIFVKGSIKAFRSVTKYKLQLDKITSTNSAIPPESVVDLNVNNHSNDYVIRTIPNTLISIGKMATFIGLGIAIYDSSELLVGSSEADSEKLLSVLGVIAFKFQTSVYGIFLSLVFISSSSKYYQKSISELKGKKLLEVYSKRIGFTELSNDLRGFVEKVGESTIKLESVISDFTQRSRASNVRLIESLQLTSNRVSTAIELLTTEQATLLNNLKNTLDENSKKLSKQNENINETLTYGLNSLNSAIKENGDTQTKAIESALGNIKEQIDSFNIEIKQITQSSTESLSKMTENLDTTTSQLSSDLSHSLGKLDTSLVGLNKSIKDGLESIDIAVRDLDAQIRVQNDNNETNTKHLKDLVSSVRVLGNHVGNIILPDTDSPNPMNDLNS
ncbi:MAG: hypothetical protein LAT81_16775 [Oceanicaulis sp.]|nr:hypothetical protein [Oceanicaulis sp.]